MPEHSIHAATEEHLASTLLSRAPKRAILVGVDIPGNDWHVEESLDELEQLALTAGVTCMERVIQRLARP
jgi:GTP-binding protein HflX